MFGKHETSPNHRKKRHLNSEHSSMNCCLQCMLHFVLSTTSRVSVWAGLWLYFVLLATFSYFCMPARILHNSFCDRMRKYGDHRQLVIYIVHALVGNLHSCCFYKYCKNFHSCDVLCVTTCAGKRTGSLKHGRIDIVQLLRDLPKTKHHSGAFSVDVMRATVSGGDEG